jgi:hypothetical protein
MPDFPLKWLLTLLGFSAKIQHKQENAVIKLPHIIKRKKR